MIHNIQILHTHTPEPTPAYQAQLALAQLRIEEHHEGKHPWGEKRRDCPLCQQGY